MPDFAWTKFLKRPAYYLDRIVEGRYEERARAGAGPASAAGTIVFLREVPP